MITWPSSLPLPERDGYGYELPELNLRTDFAFGGRTRPLYTDGPDIFAVSVDLTAPQIALLQGFIRFEIANGSAWFEMPIQASGSVDMRTVRMLGPVRFSAFGANDFRAEMQLETRIGTTMAIGTFELVGLYGSFGDLSLFMQAVETAVNGDPA